MPGVLFVCAGGGGAGECASGPRIAESTNHRINNAPPGMTHHFRQTRRVQFAETDLAGIVHFSNFYRYMEEAEHAFYRSLGYSVHDMPGDAPGSKVGWPRVHASADFRKPLRFEEEFVVELLIEEIRSKTISYLARFWKEDGELAATGKMVVVCVSFDSGERRMRAVAIPAAMREKIAEAPAELLAAPAPADS